MRSITNCQSELHSWGKANRAAFDPTKESKHILSLTRPVGQPFKLLGVIFDCGLAMSDAVAEVVSEAGWKLRTLLRTKRYYTDADLIVLYKAHLLSFLEFRTPAIYHATRAVLARLDAVPTRFLREACVSEVDALVHFNLAPLSVRRDVAMLGVIHRTMLDLGPPHFRKFFKRADVAGVARHRNQLKDPRDNIASPLIRRSALGLVAVYNFLPDGLV
jgi:hypothetical protein